MKIAITGGSGRIGRATVALALAQGHSVVSLDRAHARPRGTPPGVTFAAVNTTEYARFERAIRGCEALIHLAAIPSPGRHPDYEVHNNNVVSSYNALSAAARLGIKRVCQASSINATGVAYSRAPRFDYFPLDEAHPTYTEDPYSLSKWICELQADSFVRLHEDMVIASLRFHWVVPEREQAAAASRGKAEQTAKSLWSYTLLSSAAEACLLGITAPVKGHEVFYITGPDTVAEEPSLELRDRFYPNVPVRGDLSGHQSFFDSSKAGRLLGWTHPAPP